MELTKDLFRTSAVPKRSLMVSVSPLFLLIPEQSRRTRNCLLIDVQWLWFDVYAWIFTKSPFGMDSYTHSARKVVGFFTRSPLKNRTLRNSNPCESRKHQKIPIYRVYGGHASIIICGTLSRSHVCKLIYDIYFALFCSITCKYLCVWMMPTTKSTPTTII